ncbi:uncharacterized protein BP5553_04400 [Venustampulla echinocandica]|uniref:Zn(2)-C6 fungal-type domain-containing protein n=1 Tax=Venustampulla echinocandica TaxID=2656787 RepID=A0A370TN68_9HELO|nr:uncharacterized protein BP5553_04400 [Venustampulla echinocandica]RDL36967.1 hypothetical protein BP5553_04400 [Venustampulla echinocandica]
MVGVPTSNRCDSCRRRKKKCGEEQPSCVQCIRGGRSCVYQTQWKFVDEAPHWTRYYSGRQFVYDATDLSLEEAYAKYKYVDEGVRPDGRLVIVRENLHFLHLSRNRTDQTHARSWVPRYLETNHLGVEFAYCLESNARGTLVPLRLSGSFIDAIPARLGLNQALDNAVSCLCAIYRGTLSAPYLSHKPVYQSYVRALASLRLCLSDEAYRLEPETLCASILLQVCEIIVNDDRAEWSHLARGTARLLSARGSQRYTTDFEHAMLHAQLSHVIAQAVSFNEHCFLASPEWRPLLSRTPVWPSQTALARSMAARSRLTVHLLDFPSLVKHFRAIDKKQMYQKGPEEHPDSLLHKAHEITDRLKKWREAEVWPPPISSSTNDMQDVQDHILYPETVAGVSDCVANMALLNITQILHTLCQAKLRAARNDPDLLLEIGKLIESPKTLLEWRKRATSAYRIVQSMAPLAAKPLDFGIRMIAAQAADKPRIPWRNETLL